MSFRYCNIHYTVARFFVHPLAKGAWYTAKKPYLSGVFIIYSLNFIKNKDS